MLILCFPSISHSTCKILHTSCLRDGLLILILNAYLKFAVKRVFFLCEAAEDLIKMLQSRIY